MDNIVVGILLSFAAKMYIYRDRVQRPRFERMPGGLDHKRYQSDSEPDIHDDEGMGYMSRYAHGEHETLFDPSETTDTIADPNVLAMEEEASRFRCDGRDVAELPMPTRDSSVPLDPVLTAIAAAEKDIRYRKNGDVELNISGNRNKGSTSSVLDAEWTDNSKNCVAGRDITRAPEISHKEKRMHGIHTVRRDKTMGRDIIGPYSKEGLVRYRLSNSEENSRSERRPGRMSSHVFGSTVLPSRTTHMIGVSEKWGYTTEVSSGLNLTQDRGKVPISDIRACESMHSSLGKRRKTGPVADLHGTPHRRPLQPGAPLDTETTTVDDYEGVPLSDLDSNVQPVLSKSILGSGNISTGSDRRMPREVSCGLNSHVKSTGRFQAPGAIPLLGAGSKMDFIVDMDVVPHARLFKSASSSIPCNASGRSTKKDRIGGMCTILERRGASGRSIESVARTRRDVEPSDRLSGVSGYRCDASRSVYQERDGISGTDIPAAQPRCMGASSLKSSDTVIRPTVVRMGIEGKAKGFGSDGFGSRRLRPSDALQSQWTVSEEKEAVPTMGATKFRADRENILTYPLSGGPKLEIEQKGPMRGRSMGSRHTGPMPMDRTGYISGEKTGVSKKERDEWDYRTGQW